MGRPPAATERRQVGDRVRGAEKGGKTAHRAVGMDHLTVQSQAKGQAAKCPDRRRYEMSYKSRARKRQIRKHQKQERAADKRIERYLKSVRERRAIGLASAR